MAKKATLIFFIFLFFFVSNKVNAQFENLGQIDIRVKESDVSLDMEPLFPRPNERVSITINSFATNLDTANISYYIDGKLIKSGKGLKNFSLILGKQGTVSNLKIKMDLLDGYSIEKNIAIKPSSVDLLWEADTYTPPFFKGKRQFSHQSIVKLVAIPHILQNGVEIPENKLLYKWSKDGEILGDRNGYGRNILKIATSLISRDMIVGVEVEDPETGFSAYNEVNLSPKEPFVVFYKKDPLYGIQYQKAILSTLPLTGQEIELVAVPYFFNTEENGTKIKYTWTINGSDIQDGENRATRIFRKVGDVFGTSNVSIKVENLDKILQFGESTISVNFEKPKENSLGSDFEQSI